jgi:enterochelin esterase-like enzyme
VGSQSGSFFWPEGTGGAPDGEALVKEIQAYAGTKPLRIYQDNGSPDDNMQCNADLDQVLTAKGYAHLHVVDAGAQHDWPYWSNRWPQLLKYLFPPN